MLYFLVVAKLLILITLRVSTSNSALVVFVMSEQATCEKSMHCLVLSTVMSAIRRGSLNFYYARERTSFH